MKKNAILQIYGRVQGVGFRYSAVKSAKKFNVYGYIKNNTDKSVSAEIEGEEENVNLFIEWCKKSPSLSRVDNVTVQSAPIKNHESFNIKY